MEILPLCVGYALDLRFADPSFRLHPVRLMGDLIASGDRIGNQGRWRTGRGALLVLLLCLLVALTFVGAELLLERLPSPTNLMALLLFRSVFVFLFLANQGLIREGRAVFDAVDRSLAEGRKQLARIVGRDTVELDEHRIRVAVFESMSENLSDGVVAPLFYFAVAGVPGMAVYKMINTLDSMIGYRNDRYRDFGRVAARLDDVANLIPSRLTAILLVLVSGRWGACRTVWRYGSAHSSPNSGYPESALAGILGCRFGGPNRYGGVVVDKPWIGDMERTIAPGEIDYVSRLNHRVTLTSIVLVALVVAALRGGVIL